MSIETLKALIVLVINKQEFIQAALLLLFTALLTGLLVPWINSNLTHRKFKQQKLFEAALSKQNKIIEAQSQLLNELEQIIWNHYLRAVAVVWYKCQAKDEAKSVASFETYDDGAWDFYGHMQQALGKARRLVAPNVLRELKLLYRSLMKMDARLVDLMKSSSNAVEWQEFFADLQSRRANEVERVMALVAADLGLLGYTETGRDLALNEKNDYHEDLLPRANEPNSLEQSGASVKEKPFRGCRRALCVGINEYRTAPLRGAVPDANAWSNAFAQIGFESCITLLDADATRRSVLNSLHKIVGESSPGDVIAFQFSGLGTSYSTPGKYKEHGLLLPYDYLDGACISVDEIYEVLAGAPDGVCATCFLDCCFSSPITRFAIGLGSAAHRPDKRGRYLNPSMEIDRKIAQFAATEHIDLSADRSRLRQNTVVFYASTSNEVAWELDGQGVFSLYATQVLQAESDALTNEQFAAKVSAAYGHSPDQHTVLSCNPERQAAPLLQSLN